MDITHYTTYFDGYRNRRAGVGKCHCGEEVVLIDQYMGACECPNCGQWYNLSGQELKDPSEWEEDYDY